MRKTEGEFDRDRFAQQCNRVKSICSSPPSPLRPLPSLLVRPSVRPPGSSPSSPNSQCPDRSPTIYSRADRCPSSAGPASALSIRAMLASLSLSLSLSLCPSPEIETVLCPAHWATTSRRNKGTERKGGAAPGPKCIGVAAAGRKMEGGEEEQLINQAAQFRLLRTIGEEGPVSMAAWETKPFGGNSDPPPSYAHDKRN